MKSLYITGRRYKPKRKKYFWRYLFIALILMAVIGAIGWWIVSRQSINSEQTDGAVRTVSFPGEPTKHITEQFFEMDLPSDWEESYRRTVKYWRVSWQGTSREHDGRTIDVYVDYYPPKFAPNRLIPVEADGDKLIVGNASRNCLSLMDVDDEMSDEQKSKLPPPKVIWQDVEFTCDNRNYNRNVVATGSKEGLNQVTLTGETSGKHRYLIIYSDHASLPNEELFPKVLKSFRAI